MIASLHKLRVLNTRPYEQAKDLSLAINKAGGIAIECPALVIEASDTPWLSSFSASASSADYAIFISANAVNYCFTHLAQQKLSWPATLQVIAIGEGTAAALANYDISVHLMPLKADSEHLLALTELQQINTKTILLFKGEEGRTLIADTLQDRGAILVIFSVYKRVIPKTEPQYLHSLWRDDAVDIILFTSQQAMHNLFTLFGEQARTWLCSKPCLVLSNRLAKLASLLGMQTILVSSPAMILETLQQFKQGLIDDRQQ